MQARAVAVEIGADWIGGDQGAARALVGELFGEDVEVRKRAADVARRLTEAKQTIPHFYVSIDVELDALLKLRGELNAKSPMEGPGAFKLSVNDLLIKACAVTLRRVPKVTLGVQTEPVIVGE